MDRYYQANSAADPPSAPANNPRGYPANGKPAVGINGTVPGEWWYHAITEELRNAIVALGGTPDFTKIDQLATSLMLTFAQTTQSIMSRLAAVATSGEYNDLLDKPVIPAAQVNSDWEATSGVAVIFNKPVLAPVATSGSYADLLDPPKSVIVNLPSGATAALDLTPIRQGNPEIIFNLSIANDATTAISIINPPASGVLAEFALVVNNGTASVITWPSNIKWPQGDAPSLTGVANKLDTFVIYTQDGGATYCGFVAAQNQ